ncbi:MAG: hypothetical protein QM270_10025 [Bacillota bacterium]|nr:hypothetical protein [Bacillota bacterium]
MKRIRTPIIGQGRSGRDIHGLILPQPGDLYRIADNMAELPERRARAGCEFGCPVHADYRALSGCDVIDLIFNTSCSCRHVRLVLELPEDGLDVPGQKAPTCTAADVPWVGAGISFCSAFPAPACRYQATLGSLEGDLTELKWHWFDDREAPNQVL